MMTRREREDSNMKLMTQGILRAMDRLQSGNWFEVNIEQTFLPNEGFHRALRLCVEYGWMEEGRAISGAGHRAYRMTAQGFAVYDRAKLLSGEITEVEKLT